MGIDGRKLPDHVRERIRAQLREKHRDDPAMLAECLRGLGYAPDAPAATKPAARKGPKPRRGTIVFDSENEARAFDQLHAEHPCVIAHGCIRLCDDAHIEPDFIVVHEVLPDGRFVGELVDAKAIWKGHRAHHEEGDWKAKRKWLADKFKLLIRLVEGRHGA